jgi:peptidoglycan-associated lipoprotein
MSARFGNALLCGLLGFLVTSAGCSHRAASKATTPQAPSVTPSPAPPTVTLQASRGEISHGESVSLRWSTTNATSVSLSPEVGSVGVEGITSVTPSESTTYTAMAIGPGGSARASTRVTVSVRSAVAATPRPTLEELFTREVQDAFFDYDRANIRGDARSALGKTAEFLRSYPGVAIVIEGHCDERGSAEYNVALGDRRSGAAKDFLIEQGVAAGRIQTVSYGKERPFCTEENEQCWQENRRAHLRMAGTNSTPLSGN